MTFSQRLQEWLKSQEPKTIQGLDRIVATKSFAIIFLILLSPAATPLPTGGATHLFGIISALISLELVIGRHNLWIPKRWQEHPIGSIMETKTIPILIKAIRFCEKFARPRGKQIINHPVFLRFIGLAVAIFALGTTTAVPFSGLDTLPALGGSLIALGLILDDILFVGVGCLAGSIGIGLQILLGKATITYLTHLF